MVSVHTLQCHAASPCMNPLPPLSAANTAVPAPLQNTRCCPSAL